jgi:hypothetical protein
MQAKGRRKAGRWKTRVLRGAQPPSVVRGAAQRAGMSKQAPRPSALCSSPALGSTPAQQPARRRCAPRPSALCSSPALGSTPAQPFMLRAGPSGSVHPFAVSSSSHSSSQARRKQCAGRGEARGVSSQGCARVGPLAWACGACEQRCLKPGAVLEKEPARYARGCPRPAGQERPAAPPLLDAAWETKRSGSVRGVGKQEVGQCAGLALAGMHAAALLYPGAAERAGFPLGS